MLHVLWQEISSGLHNSEQLMHVIIRLVAAALLGALVGIQRESTRKPAGLRTHMLVSLATAAFVISCSSVGMSSAASVWMTAAIGITVGLGSLGIAVMVTIPALIILALEGLERRVEDKQGSNDRGTTKQP